ncbi:hypothetical protein [Pseudomonas sp. Irchel 3E13]|jgi:hypothetical protein|uniref:phosphoribosyltransferase-like protein n=1 Tax=Pseudomonas sp. Irchel 3E13 TaxID=2008975 RepID=UPI00117A375D|nr:hypothetical protein [Pseudomonas sp. Irchel 3E13]
MKGIRDRQIWLQQFNKTPEDFALATHMLKSLLYIDHFYLKTLLANVILGQLVSEGPCALFIERELPRTKSTRPPAMYKEEKILRSGFRKRRLRATGAAQQVVLSLRYNRQDVGSEGVIAQMMSSLCKRHSDDLLLQPSADEIRKCKVRKVVIVTDFIGSGERVNRMLGSLWRVRSVRSWASYGRIEMCVVAASGTDKGVACVRRHPCRPTVLLGESCPTLQKSFSPDVSLALIDLCKRYGSFDKKPLGHGDVGALIAFEHSAPNNMPAIFTRENKSRVNLWKPLFPDRRTEVLWTRGQYREEEIIEAFGLLGLQRITETKAYGKIGWNWRQALLVTAAIYKSRRTVVDLIALTNMPVAVLFDALHNAQELGWITLNRRMTDTGRCLITRFSETMVLQVVTATAPDAYYPSQLRAPT